MQPVPLWKGFLGTTGKSHRGLVGELCLEVAQGSRGSFLRAGNSSSKNPIEKVRQTPSLKTATARFMTVHRSDVVWLSYPSEALSSIKSMIMIAGTQVHLSVRPGRL